MRKWVISKKEDGDSMINEKDLIANRSKSKDIVIDDSMPICPKHSCSYGMDWYDVKSTCHLPDYDTGTKSSSRDSRFANINICREIEIFCW